MKSEAQSVEPDTPSAARGDAVIATGNFPLDLTTVLTVALQSHVRLLGFLSSPLTTRDEQILLDLGGKLPAPVHQVSKNRNVGLTGDLLTLARLVKAMARVRKSRENLQQCIDFIEKLGHRNTRQLDALQKQLRGLKSEIAWPQEAPASQSYLALLDAESKLEDLAGRNLTYQDGLLQQTREQIEQLGKLLDAGNSAEAGAVWDRIQGNIGNLGGKIQHQLNQQIAVFRGQINELRDWKKFAAAEKKQELIVEISQLQESPGSPPERARQIRNLHERWKKLGYSNQNEELWHQFKEASDKAYAPCKEYFAQQKVRMADNLKHRLGICERLEQYLQNVDRTDLRIVDLKALEKQVQDEWKQYAPVEQGKVKKLQKRFYGALNEVREIRRNTARKNGELKQALVDEARKLLDLENRREAINQAKDLQARWKTVGPSFAREDRKYWSEFRAACDALFKEQEAARKAVRNEITQAIDNSRKILHKLEDVLGLDDTAFRESRKLFASLQNDFHQALSPRIKKERQQLQQQFTALTRKIEGRFRKLPDKKQLQASSALQARAAACIELEDRLMACDNATDFRQVLAGFDRSAWDEMAASGYPRWDRLMEKRLNAVMDLVDPEAMAGLVADTENQARRRLVEAEIKAHLESPEQDRQLRMELQLDQLQSKFGKAPVEDSSARENFTRDFELEFLCLGPFSSVNRRELEERASQVIRRLL